MVGWRNIRRERTGMVGWRNIRRERTGMVGWRNIRGGERKQGWLAGGI